MQQIKSCGVLVFRRQPVPSFLLMEHADRLDLPKGHVDAGESEIECALRELEEETGILTRDIDIDTRFRFTTKYRVRRKEESGGQTCEKTLVIFLGRLIRDVKIQVTEHQSYRWIGWDPPHQIQVRTIDPLLSYLCQFLETGGSL